MRKKITFLLMGALVALSMMLPCFADEPTTELVTEIATEIVTEVMDKEVTEPGAEGENLPVEDDTATDGEVPTQPQENAAEDDYWADFKAKITDTATWTMIGAALVTILTTVGTVKSKFDKISSLMHTKADNDTIQGAIKDIEKDLKDTYNKNHKEIAATLKRYEEALKNTEANEQRLYAILTLFMTNCKISDSAKAEILSILANVKTYEGDIAEFVAQAQEAIDKAAKENEEQAPATPTLDKLLDEDYMELG